MTDDDKLARAYRALAKEEPPAALDAEVLEAARRAVRPSLSRRWGVPVSIAAVLVIAGGLVLEMRSQQPGIETSPGAVGAPAPPRAVEENAREQKRSSNAGVAAPQSAPQRPAAPVAQPAEAPKRDLAPAPKTEFAPEPPAPTLATPPPAAPSAPAAAPPSAAASAPAAAPPSAAASAPAAAPSVRPAPPAPAQAPALRAAPQSESTLGREAAPQAMDAMSRGRVEKRAAAKDEVSAELEAIAKLRAGGRDEEADRALEAFRARHPDYVIPEAMMRRVQPR